MHNIPHSEETKRKLSAAKRGVPNLARRRESKVVDGVALYVCGACRDFFPVEGFYKNKRTILGITSHCRSCHVKVSIKSRDPELARKHRRESMRRRRSADISKYRERERMAARRRVWTAESEARYILNLAVKRGDIPKPGLCSRCGADGRVAGHHADYLKPLQVEWLCCECHGKEHRRAI